MELPIGQSSGAPLAAEDPNFSQLQRPDGASANYCNAAASSTPVSTGAQQAATTRHQPAVSTTVMTAAPSGAGSRSSTSELRRLASTLLVSGSVSTPAAAFCSRAAASSSEDGSSRPRRPRQPYSPQQSPPPPQCQRPIGKRRCTVTSSSHPRLVRAQHQPCSSLPGSRTALSSASVSVPAAQPSQASVDLSAWARRLVAANIRSAEVSPSPHPITTPAPTQPPIARLLAAPSYVPMTALPPPPSAASRLALAHSLVASAKLSAERAKANATYTELHHNHSASTLPPPPNAQPIPARAAPPPPELHTYHHLIARSASLFRLGHSVEGKEAMAEATALSVKVPAVLLYTATAPPPASPRICPHPASHR